MFRFRANEMAGHYAAQLRVLGAADYLGATTTPYADSHGRVSPSIRNSPQEIDVALGEIQNLA